MVCDDASRAAATSAWKAAESSSSAVHACWMAGPGRGAQSEAGVRSLVQSPVEVFGGSSLPLDCSSGRLQSARAVPVGAKDAHSRPALDVLLDA